MTEIVATMSLPVKFLMTSDNAPWHHMLWSLPDEIVRLVKTFWNRTQLFRRVWVTWQDGARHSYLRRWLRPGGAWGPARDGGTGRLPFMFRAGPGNLTLEIWERCFCGAIRGVRGRLSLPRNMRTLLLSRASFSPTRNSKIHQKILQEYK